MIQSYTPPMKILLMLIKVRREWIPRHLETFLKNIVQSELKKMPILSARSRSVLPPTLFGIGVEMDHACIWVKVACK